VEVERFWEKWRMDFNVMSLNAVPDPSATPYWEPMEELLKMWCRIEMHESE
jgi:hypothetical protein